MMLNQALKQFEMNWQDFLQRHPLDAAVAAVIFDCLAQAYQQPQRAYHGLQHINECIALLREVEHLSLDAYAVELALWFHDAVYDPQAQNNEAQSALLMQQLCQQILSPEQLHKISDWIIATQHHQATADPDLNLLLDIDLAILGAEPQRFAEYEQQIRYEYQWVESDIYQMKRGEVLKHFYQMQPIYQTAYFQSHFEQQAKANLRLACDHT